MDSFESLLAIQLPLSESGTSSSTSSTTSGDNDDESDIDNVNNEDDEDGGGSDDDDGDEEVIYSEDVINSTSSTPHYDAIADPVVTSTPPTSTQLPIALSYAAPLPPPPPSSAKNPRLVPASAVAAAAAAAAAAAKGPPTPVIVTATGPPSLGPLRVPGEYEPGASAAAARLNAQYTDSLRRRAETLMQKRLRMQRESLQKAKEMRQMTSQLSRLNSRLAEELVEQKRLVDDYDRIRETAHRALNVLHIVRDAECVLAETKDRLLAALADRDHRLSESRSQQQQQQQPTPSQREMDDNVGNELLSDQKSATATYDPLGLD